jgi:hypothetical protein
MEKRGMEWGKWELNTFAKFIIGIGIPGAESLRLQLFKNFPSFLEPEGSFSCSQKPIYLEHHK